MEIRNVKKLVVKYNGTIVGYLAELEDNKIGFQYDDDWVKTGFSISPFSLPLSNKVYLNEKLTFNGLYGVFQDSLPDGWGELLLNRMLSKKGINPNKISPLTKLTLVSGNGLGGLSYEPCQTQGESEIDFDLDEIAKEARQLLEDESIDIDLDKIYNLGGSSGGARPKAHIKLDNDYWIVKFPCIIDPKNIGEQEYKANKLAKECGINVNEFKLFKSKICSGYFGAKRFDRKDGKRVHMISLSSLLETTHKIPNLDYMHLFQVIQNICVDKNDVIEAYKRMCFNVLYGNKDDHGKNFSFLYDEDKKGYVLSPAYDLTKTSNKLEHEMTVNGNANPNKEDLLNIGKQLKLLTTFCNSIINKILQVIS